MTYCISTINKGQRAVFDQVVEAVLPGITTTNLNFEVASSSMIPPPPPHRIFFLDAPGGTGKTFVTLEIQRYLKVHGNYVIAVAISAVAAQILEGGGTAPSTLKIPIPWDQDVTCSLSGHS